MHNKKKNAAVKHLNRTCCTPAPCFEEVFSEQGGENTSRFLFCLIYQNQKSELH